MGGCGDCVGGGVGVGDSFAAGVDMGSGVLVGMGVSVGIGMGECTITAAGTTVGVAVRTSGVLVPRVPRPENGEAIHPALIAVAIMTQIPPIIATATLLSLTLSLS